MKAAGLTHGAFYGYFKSKDDLTDQAVAEALGMQRRRRALSWRPLRSNICLPRTGTMSRAAVRSRPWPPRLLVNRAGCGRK